MRLHACFVVSPVTYTSVTLINRKSPLDLLKISCFFLQHYPHPLVGLQWGRPELCAASQSEALGCACRKSPTPRQTPHSLQRQPPPCLESLGFCLFPVMILLGVWGFKHAETSQPWVQFICNMYQGKEYTQCSQKINHIYILLQLPNPPTSYLPNCPPTAITICLLSFSSCFQIFIENWDQ